MPQWGRPPGARMGRSFRSSRGRWDEVRVDEIESEDSDIEGVPLHPRAIRNRRLRSNELMDVANGESSESDDESSDDEHNDYVLDDTSQDSTLAYAMELAMRDREEELVERALDRIRRAQVLGKRKVRLSSRELEALERRRMHSEAATSSLRRTKTSRVKVKNIHPSTVPTSRLNTLWAPESGYTSAVETPSGYYVSASSTTQPRPITPTLPSLRLSQQNGSPRVPGAYAFPDDPSSRPASSGRLQPPLLSEEPQRVQRSRSSSNAAPFVSPTYQYLPTQVLPFDPRYPMPASPGYNLSTPPETIFQPVYRPASGESYANRTVSNHDNSPQPAATTGKPTQQRTVSGSTNNTTSSSDNGVKVDPLKEAKEPAKSKARKTTGTVRGRMVRVRTRK
ncbi:Prenylated Rab acceptor 1 [Ophidiomyces ophidiicola]|uniref:Prenylated Rab acceptor 1 n=1 Tax=Ophidiomyces ophidiicola TaxID=1387563 RepID=A0ACB8UTN5_9EURO|nr:Prenylated Rab acceptor 1 [Ophidiomyces ophidiicola]KAI1906454.1 Prenylated Rab acceptor 1 [Ophidiomyces ophidiicola]KAI1906498.1 Prenylated Rab acceptor 1 [Ophidiomyces ophidiicola]KAI1920596.1 Prenylated Rab acceptor 1 [Ophidiomyces ophidiicola]KAI1935319.1 Prenylated Rab acceptor 1 [Ophidiomyces ophidiicola]KAI1938400.1 Prenylated Rab acceptor 1 [Ophidiomyces ophidiicola]